MPKCRQCDYRWDLKDEDIVLHNVEKRQDREKEADTRGKVPEHEKIQPEPEPEPEPKSEQPKLQNFDGLLDFSTKKHLKDDREDTDEQNTGQTGFEEQVGGQGPQMPPQMAQPIDFDMAGFFSAAVEMLFETLQNMDTPEEIDTKKRTKLIEKTMGLAGVFMSLDMEDVQENQVEVSPTILIIVSVGIIALPFIIKMIKNRKKSDDEEEEKDGRTAEEIR